MARYARPGSVDEALTLLAGGQWRIFAGGTDFYPAQAARPVREDVLDINALRDLRGINETSTHLVIGGGTTWTDILRADLPPALAALQQAAREVGSVQIQNRGTIAGNLCNASPAADGVPALLAVDAEVELRSARGVRHLPLAEFILGNRRTGRREDELVSAIRVPKTALTGRSAFLKLGARRYLVISIAMCAARVSVSADGRIDAAAIAVGSCSPVALRLSALERALVGQQIHQAAHIIAEADLGILTPIDDVRADAGYRLAAAREIVCRTVAGAIGAPGREQAA